MGNDVVSKLMEEVSRLRRENSELRMKLSERLSESQGKYRMLFEHTGYGAVILSSSGIIQDVNPVVLKELGEKKENLVGKSIFELPYCTKTQRNFLKILLYSHLKGERKMVHRITCRWGNKTRILEFTSASVESDKGICCIIILLRDITRRREISRKLKKAIQENKALLRELHHRAKNNLQVIYSLLNLQEDYIKNRKVKEILREIKSRIITIGFLHEKLYSSGTERFSTVRARDYLENLVHHLVNLYSEKNKNVRIETEIEDLELHMQTAIPLGLVMNEALSNALKYAFPSGKGNIKVHFGKKDGEFILSVEDDGVGLKGKTGSTRDTLGFTLMKILARQLGGTLEIKRARGTSVILKFKE